MQDPKKSLALLSSSVGRLCGFAASRAKASGFPRNPRLFRRLSRPRRSLTLL